MPKTRVTTDRAPDPAGPYSQGTVANGFLHTAGFGPRTPRLVTSQRPSEPRRDRC